MNNSPNNQSLPITEMLEEILWKNNITYDDILTKAWQLETKSLSKAHKEWATEERKRILEILTKELTNTMEFHSEDKKLNEVIEIINISNNQ